MMDDYIDYEGLILARQEQIEIFEDVYGCYPYDEDDSEIEEEHYLSPMIVYRDGKFITVEGA